MPLAEVYIKLGFMYFLATVLDTQTTPGYLGYNLVPHDDPVFVKLPENLENLEDAAPLIVGAFAARGYAIVGNMSVDAGEQIALRALNN